MRHIDQHDKPCFRAHE